MNNIDPKIWGRPGWDFLFYIAISYPDIATKQDMINMKTFLYSLGNVLPCITCRYNYSNNLGKYPLNESVLSSRYNLINWMLNIYNEIRMSNGKNFITYEDIISRYVNNKNNNFNYITINLIIICLVIIIIIILICMIKFKQK